MIPWILPGQPFPELESALSEPNGLLAVSSQLLATDILRAYPLGVFPWSDPDQPVLWWSPDPRMVLYPSHFNMSRSLRKSIIKDNYQIRVDGCFEQVMRCCAEPRRDHAGTWIAEDFVAAYTQIHQKGIGHTIEIWHQDTLVGGLYGLSMGSVFYGESMFCRVSDSSKIALAFLCFLHASLPEAMIDCQVENSHLVSLGAENISRQLFRQSISSLVVKKGLDWKHIANSVDVLQAEFINRVSLGCLC